MGTRRSVKRKSKNHNIEMARIKEWKRTTIICGIIILILLGVFGYALYEDYKLCNSMTEQEFNEWWENHNDVINASQELYCSVNTLY